MVDWDGGGAVEGDVDGDVGGDADASACLIEPEDVATRARRSVRRRVSYRCERVALVPAQ
jgi:hypothetical protein